jgi:hypothetical protein
VIVELQSKLRVVSEYEKVGIKKDASRRLLLCPHRDSNIVPAGDSIPVGGSSFSLEYSESMKVMEEREVPPRGVGIHG